MSRRKEVKEFEGLTLTVTQLGPIKALEILPEVAKMFVPLLNAMAQNPEIAKRISDKQPITLADALKLRGAVTGIAEVMSGRALARLAPDLFSLSTADIVATNGQKLTIKLDSVEGIEAAFGSHPADILSAVMFAARVSFMDFMPGLGQPAGPTPKPSASPGSTPST